ncbi:13685_t:CDS:2, partial [Ambispora leptoticha]
PTTPTPISRYDRSKVTKTRAKCFGIECKLKRNGILKSGVEFKKMWSKMYNALSGEVGLSPAEESLQIFIILDIKCVLELSPPILK